MNNLILSRRTLAKVSAAIAGSFALPEIVEAEEPRRKFWFLDQRHVGLKKFYYVYGYVHDSIYFPENPKCDFHGSILMEGNGWANLGWEVEQVMTGDGRNLYRVRIVPAFPSFSGTVTPTEEKANPWMTPAEAEVQYGIIVRR